MYGEALGMPLALAGILAQVVVSHVRETEPDGKREAEHPGNDHAPADPIGDAQNEADFFRIAPVTEPIARDDAPKQTAGPHCHDEQPLAPGVAEELLFFELWFCHDDSRRI